MNRISKEFKSGFIFLLAIIFLVYGLKYLKGLNVFQTNKPYYAIYDDIDGLQIGSSIRLNGFNVGMVNNIILNSDNNLVVTLNIDGLYNIPENSICKIVNQDLMGTKGVSLILGQPNSFASSVIRSGFSSAGVLIETLSAPLFNICFASLTLFIPPATLKGIFIISAMIFTQSFETIPSYVLAPIS